MKGKEEGGGSQAMKPKSPPSIDPSGFFAGWRCGFLIVTLDRSSLKGVVELVIVTSTWERVASESVEGDLEERLGEGTNDPKVRGLGESLGGSKEGEEDREEGRIESQVVWAISRLD